MANPIAPSTSEQVQSESKIGGLFDQLRLVIRRSNLNDDQLQAIRDSSQLPTLLESVWARLAAIVCNIVRLPITTPKEFVKPDWMKKLLKGNDALSPGDYQLTFEPFLNDGENSVKGDEMVRRAKASGAMSGLQIALYLLANQDLIPTEFRGKKYLVFAEAEALGSSGGRRVACLYWGGRSWVLGWVWLGGGFRGDGLLVRARKV